MTEVGGIAAERNLPATAEGDTCHAIARRFQWCDSRERPAPNSDEVHPQHRGSLSVPLEGCGMGRTADPMLVSAASRGVGPSLHRARAKSSRYVRQPSAEVVPVVTERVEGPHTEQNIAGALDQPTKLPGDGDGVPDAPSGEAAGDLAPPVVSPPSDDPLEIPAFLRRTDSPSELGDDWYRDVAKGAEA